MFGFVQWDSPLALLVEFLFALGVFILVFIVVRRVEKGQRSVAPSPHASPRAGAVQSSGGEPASGSEDKAPTGG